MMNNSDDIRSQLPNFEFLDSIDLTPLLAYDRIDRNPIPLPLHCIDGDFSEEVVRKLQAANIWHLHRLVGYSLEEIARVAGLLESEVDEIATECKLRNITLPTFYGLYGRSSKNSDTNKRIHRSQEFAADCEQLLKMSSRGSAEASIVVGRLIKLGLIKGKEEPFYLRAKGLGSLQGGNDYGVMLHLRHRGVPCFKPDVCGHYSSPAKRGIPESIANLAFAEVDFSVPCTTDIENARLLVAKSRRLGLELADDHLDELIWLGDCARLMNTIEC